MPYAGFYHEQIENNAYFYDQSQKANSWYWDFGDGNYSTEQNPSHTYSNSGPYNVVQFVSNNLNSWDTTSAIISITVGIYEHQQPLLSLYPNPAQINILLKNNDSEAMNVHVFNTRGLRVDGLKILPQQIYKLNVEGYLPGIYFVKYRNTKGVMTKTFLKIR
jgi:PKD repeat protein